MKQNTLSRRYESSLWDPPEGGSKRIHCPQLNISFTSVKNASWFTKVDVKDINSVLKGLKHSYAGYSFIDHNPRIHPKPTLVEELISLRFSWEHK